MDFKEITDQVKDFSNQFKYNKLLFFSNAIAGEVGEYCNTIKKYYRTGKQKNAGNLSKLGFELSDIFIYLVLNAKELNLDLESFILEKLKIVNKKGD